MSQKLLIHSPLNCVWNSFVSSEWICLILSSQAHSSDADNAENNGNKGVISHNRCNKTIGKVRERSDHTQSGDVNGFKALAWLYHSCKAIKIKNVECLSTAYVKILDVNLHFFCNDDNEFCLFHTSFFILLCSKDERWVTRILSAICWICWPLLWISSFSLASRRSTISSLFTWFSRVFLPSWITQNKQTLCTKSSHDFFKFIHKSKELML